MTTKHSGGHAGQSRLGLRKLALWGIALVALGLAGPTKAAVVVSNLGGTGSAGLGGTGFGYGRSFTTGGTAYGLDSIDVSLSDFFAGSSGVSVQLWSDSGSGPGALIENLGVVGTASTSFTTLTASSSSNPGLNAATKYWVVVMYDSGVPRVPAQAGSASGDNGSTIQGEIWTTSDSGSAWATAPEFDGALSFSVAATSRASVSSILRTTSSPSNEGTLQWTVTFSESVTGVSTANFSLATGGSVGGASLSGVSGSGTSWTVTAATGNGDGTLGLNFSNDSGLSPLVSNEPFTGEVYTVDKTAPTIAISSPTPSSVVGTNGATATYTITYSDNVGIRSISLNSGDISVNTTGTAIATPSVSGSGTVTRTVTMNPIGGTGTAGISLAGGTATDAAGNSAGTAGPSATFAVNSPEIVLHDGASISDASVVNNGASSSIGTTVLGAPITKTFNLENTGNATLNVSLTTMPSGFSRSGPFPGSIAAGANTTFIVQLDSVAAGSHSGDIVIATDDSDENPFTFTVSGVVGKDTPTVAVISDNNDPSVVGEAYTVEVEVTGASATPTGTVVVDDGNGNAVTITLSGGNGNGLLTGTSAGTKTLTATYNGDSNHNTASSSSESHTVNQGTPAVTITSDTPDASVVGEDYTVQASVSGGGVAATGTVTVTDSDGNNATITLSGGSGSTTLAGSSPGAKTLTATYGGDANYLTGTDTEAHTVNQATPTVTITSDANDPSAAGEAYTVQLTVTAPGAVTPTGTVTVTDGDGNNATITLSGGAASTSLTSTLAGSKTLTASYSGDSNFTSATDTEAHTVSKATPTVTITSDSPDPSGLGDAYTVGVSVSGGGSSPTGTVTVSDGEGNNATITLAGGTGSGTLTTQTSGNKILTATYSGDANYNSGTDTETHTVNQATPTVTIVSDAGDPSVVGQAYTVQVTVSGNAATPTGTVTLVDGSGASATINLSGGTGSATLTSTTAGTKNLSATYSGDSNYGTAVDTESHTVSKGSPTVTITSDANDPSAVSEAYAVEVTVTGAGTNPTGTVTVGDGDGNQTTITLSGGSGSGNITTLTTGDKTLTATYSGDSNYQPATDTEAHTVEAVIVSNLGGAGELGLAAASQGWARAFTIGNTAYVMESVTLALASLSGSSGITVQLWSDDGANGPGSVLENLGSISSSTTTFANQTLVSTAKPTLSKNTKYWLVTLYASGQPRLRLSEGLISGSDGATVNPGVFFTESAGATWADAGIGIENAVSFAVRGTAITSIASIVRTGSPIVNTATVQWTVTFGDALAGLTTANFGLSTSGTIAGASVAGVTGAGTTWTVTANTGTGDGTIGLTLNTDTGLTPLLSNEPVAGETYTIDKTAPTISIGSPSVASVLSSSGTEVIYTITYADNLGVTAITLSDGNVTTNITGTATSTRTVSGSGNTTRTVTMSSIAGQGTLGLSVAAATATDAAGNTALAAGPSATFSVITPEIVVHDGPLTGDASIANNGLPASMGTTTVGATLAKTYNIENSGTSTLNVSLQSLPARFSLSGAFPNTIAPGTSATFTVLLDVTAAGSHSGNIVIATDDLDENPFAFTLNGVVNQATPTVTITSDAADPSLVGQAYTVQVTVAGAVTPTGTVVVDDGTGNNATITLSAGTGSASLTGNTAGSKTLTASYSGDSNFLAATDAEAHTVNQATPTVTITSDANDPSVVGEAYTVQVSVTGAGIAPTGTVTLSDGDGNTTPITLSGGTGSGSLTGTAAGAKNLTAAYGGDANYLSAVDSEPHTVNQATPTVTITSDANDPSTVGEAYSVHVAVTGPVTPTGTVAVNDGEGNIATITLAGGIGSTSLPSITAGTKTLTASYSGDSNFVSAADTEVHTVTKGTPLVSLTSDLPDPSLLGGSYTVAISVAGGGVTATGAVNVSDGLGNSTVITLTNGAGTGSLPAPTAGPRTLTANYLGDGNYNSAQATGLHTVNQGVPVVTITADANDPSVVGETYTVQVTVSGPGATPTGTVTVRDNQGGALVLTLTNGVGSGPLSATTSGSRILTADYAGDSNYSSGFDTETHTVNRALPVVTITADTPDASALGGNYSVSITVTGPGVTPTGFVQVDDGTGNQAVITLANGAGTAVLTSPTAGTKTLTANYSGDINYETGADTEPHTVSQGTPTVTITGDGPDPSALSGTYTVSVNVAGAGASPSGTVTVTDGAGNQADITLVNGTGTASLSGNTAGLKTLTASYAGDTNYTTAAATEPHTVAPAAATVTISSDFPDPSPVGAAYTVSVTVTGSGGTPTGTVVVADGTGGSTSITLNAGTGSGTLTATSAGGKLLTATYSGDANFHAATATEAHTVTRAVPVLTIGAGTPDPSVVGQVYNVPVTVTGSGATPTGLVTLSDGGGGFGSLVLTGGSGTIPMLSHSVGDKTLTATYSGDLNYEAASTSTTHSVHRRLVSNLGGGGDLPVSPNGAACARPFVSGFNPGTLESVTVTLRSAAGASAVLVQLWSDNGTGPGTVLESLGLANSTNTGFAEVTLVSGQQTVLSANTRYWLVLFHDSGQPIVPLNANAATASDGATLGAEVQGSTDAGTTWADRAASPNAVSFAVSVSPVVGTANITAITRTSAITTSATSVSWTVQFDRSVGGVNAGNFALVPAGAIGGTAITSVTRSGNLWTVTASTGTNNGTLGLNLVNDTLIQPPLTNEPFGGEVYTIDKTPPGPVFKITGIDIVGGRPRLRFGNLDGTPITAAQLTGLLVTVSGDIGAAVWTPLSNALVIVGNEAQIIDPGATGIVRFYQVRTAP